MKIITIFTGDITKLCRLCLKRSVNLIDLYTHSHKLGGRIVDVIERCTTVRIGIRHEKLPNVICKKCRIELEKVHLFLNKASQSEKALQNYLQQVNPGYESTNDVSIKHESIDDYDTNRSWEETNADQDTAPAPTFNPESVNFNENLMLKYDYLAEQQTPYGETFNNFPLNAIKQETIDVANSMPSTADSSTSFEPFVENKSPKENKILQCEICNKIFTKAKNLNVHKRIHADAKPEQLVETHYGETFNDLPLNDIKQETIDVANPMPSTADSSTIFEENESSEKKILQCKICNKIFTKAKYLNVHKRIHTGAKPFQCDACGKCYSREDNLKMHKRLHTGVKPFKCTVCSKCFSTDDHVRRHMRSHSGKRPYQCDICGTCFTQISHLKTHNLKHTGEKKFQCDMCSKSFILACVLKKHKLVHARENQFHCDLCDKSYSKLVHLTKHKKRHAGENL